MAGTRWCGRSRCSGFEGTTNRRAVFTPEPSGGHRGPSSKNTVKGRASRRRRTRWWWLRKRSRWHGVPWCTTLQNVIMLTAVSSVRPNPGPHDLVIQPREFDPDHALRSSPARWPFGCGFRRAKDMGGFRVTTTYQAGTSEWRNSKIGHDDEILLNGWWSLFLPIFEIENMCAIGKKVRAKSSEDGNLANGQGRNCCDQGSHGSCEYWIYYLPGKYQQIKETFQYCGSGRTSRFAWANKSTSSMALLRRTSKCLGNVFQSKLIRAPFVIDNGLLVATPIDLRTKKADNFFTLQQLQGFWCQLKKNNPQIDEMFPTVATKSYKQQEVIWQKYHLCVASAEQQILGGKHFLI